MLQSFTSPKCKNNDKVIIQLISVSPYVSKIYSPAKKDRTLKYEYTILCRTFASYNSERLLGTL